LKNLVDVVSENFGLLRTAMRDSNKQSVSFRNKKPGPSALRSVDFGQSFIVVCVDLLDDVDLASATDRINAMTLTVVEDVVGIAGDIDLCSNIARIGVEHDELGRQTAPNNQSMVRFIECHWK